MNNEPVLALNATHESGSVSDKYNFFSSADIVEFFNNKGWEMTDYKQVIPRVGDPAYVKHMITFDHRDYSDRDNIPRILMTNAHNGTSSFKLHTGIFRVVCSNGLIVGSTFEQVRIRHINTTEEQVYQSIDKLVDQFNPVMNKIARFSDILLEPEQKLEVARKVADERFTTYTQNDLTALLSPIRNEDVGDDLWTVSNVLQEKCMYGGSRVNRRKVRPIKGIDRTVGFNIALWDIMEETADLVAV